MTLRRGNPMSRVIVILLAFDALVYGLAIPVMIMVSNAAPPVAWTTGGIAAGLALLGAILLRFGLVGWLLGWVAQLAGVLLGIVTPSMWFVGGVFAVLFVVTFALGKRIDETRAGGPGA